MKTQLLTRYRASWRPAARIQLAKELYFPHQRKRAACATLQTSLCSKRTRLWRDFDLVGGEVSPLAAGRPITIAWMNGRSRAYAITARNPPGKTALSVAFNDRCDMVVATVVLPHDRPALIEPGVIAFLNGSTVLRWPEVTLGL
jgi:hypothetical protein